MKYLLLLITFIFTLNLSAQDTIKIKTFNWSSTNRADSFQFPDNPGETYRKILMLYNMRCHDAVVGTGSTGCLEWDYSCNTFITDPTRKDSSRQSHPDYTISNFTGNNFDYTSKPTYTYYQYDQHNTILTGTADQYAAIGGLGKLIQLNPGAVTSKLQYLYLKSELSANGLTAGDIQKLLMDIETDGEELGFFRIRIKQTGVNTLDPNTPELDGFMEVYFRNTLFENTGINEYNFYQPFNWDGNSNIIVEFSYTTNPGGNGIIMHGHDAGFNSSLVSSETDNALYFEGSGSASVNPEALKDLDKEISVSVWAYGSPKFLPTQTTLFEGGDNLNRRIINVHLPWENSRVYWDCGRDVNGNVDRIEKDANASDFEGKWSNWVFTKNATTGDMKIFLNGNLWHSGTGKKGTLVDLETLNFGSAISWVNNYFGSIDEVQIWDIALDQASIKSWLWKSIDNTHPNYGNLKAYYKLNEGAGNIIHSDAGIDLTGSLVTPNWRRIKGVDLYRNFEVSTSRPSLIFHKGNFSVSDQIIKIIDSTLNTQNQIIHYGLNGSQLVSLDTQYLYRTGYMPVYDESGNKVDSVLVNKEGTISIANFYHYPRSNSRFELLSLVTPYGINLDLGKTGKTFTFDVTDYAPILKGEKYMSIEFGGQWQEELDIQFLFIKGTPPRDVLNIQNIWPQGNGGHGDILNDNIFEQRAITLDPNASFYKVRSAVTGHGQNGEFIPQQHFIDVNGGNQEFQYNVWKACSKNPIYPQGGTWIFDRAGWCPGMATDVHEFDLSSYVKSGETISIDYGINAAPMGAANYLVSNQLVTYGDYNFTKDASIETIMKPNNKSVEYERINPACNMPTILVRNTGQTPIQSLEIEYHVEGGMSLTYNWTGLIQPMLSEQIELPVNSTGFWLSSNPVKIFTASLLSVNGSKDNYTENDVATSTFDLAKQFEFTDPLQIRLKTNLNPSENSYTILDSEGKVIMSRDNMAANTTYVDEVDVAPGCYTFKFEDTGGDGLSFWFFPENGSGSLKIERLFNGSIPILQKNFNPDMGGGVQYDFIKGALTSSQNIESYTLMSLYPNPAGDIVNIELHGYLHEQMQVSIIDITGKELISKKVTVNSKEFLDTIFIGDLYPGMYLLKVNNGKKSWVKQLIKE